MSRTVAAASRRFVAPATDCVVTGDDGCAEICAMTAHGRVRLVSWWRRRSLRARLTAAATLVMVMGIAAAAALLVWRVQHTLLANLDTAVTAQARTVASEAAQGHLSTPLLPSGEGGSAIQVIDSRGRVVASSANLAGEGRLFTFPVGRGEPTLARMSGVPLGDANTTYRVAGLSVSGPQGPVTIYAGLPTSGAVQSVSALVGALAVGLPVVAVLLALVGWLLIGRALRPVEQMRRQVAAISGNDLHRRLSTPTAGDELRRLATTFNELLARIETATGRQRQFVADAAHELRNPLAALRTQLEVTLRHPSGAAVDPFAADLLADTVRLSRIVEDLLQLARMDADIRQRRQAVDLNDLVLEEALRVRVRTSVRVDTTGISAARVVGDADALRRVVQNLLDNAVRHATNIVTLHTRSERSTVTLTVADDGPGIPCNERTRVFERFTRLDDARTRDAGGSGLGLAIVREVITAHGGQIRVHDNCPGARFVVDLPAFDDGVRHSNSSTEVALSGTQRRLSDGGPSLSSPGGHSAGSSQGGRT